MTLSRFETDFLGKKLVIESGHIAKQAKAAVTAQIGDTVVLATVTYSDPFREAAGFFPLMVDYEERYFAGGRIKGPRFSKREGRPSNDAVLIGRMIDRGLRPLFPQDLRNDVQIICLPLSLDHMIKPDIVAMIAACAALHISEIPFEGPVTGVRIGIINGEYVVNPTVEELEGASLNLVVMGDGERITMVECEGDEVENDALKEAFSIAMKSMAPITKFMDEIREDIGLEKAPRDQLIFKSDLTPEDKLVVDQLKEAAIPHLDKYLFNTPKGSKGERKVILAELKEKLIDEHSEKLVTPERDQEATVEYLKGLMANFFFDFIEEQVTLAILDRDQRVDGRALDEIRPLEAECGVLPRIHGSGLFSRGETQVLSIVTLGAPGDRQSIETMEHDGEKKYMHHYNFLPYAVDEVKPIRGAGRREIGHGALAEKALTNVLPVDLKFPYTIRVVTEVMGSNGSSSMAATCGSTLALMDAGVPIKKHVGGIAMGLASDGKRWKVLTDIQDLEDGPGGMDFKFAGTRNGINAVQMDMKSRGLSKEIIDATFVQMQKALDEILGFLEAVKPVPNEELSEFAPRILSFMIDPEKIGEVIGPGGKVIRRITEEFEVQIDIEDSGMVLITSTNSEGALAAEKHIKDIVRVVEVGEIFEEAKVVTIQPFGAFVNLTPGTDGMLHISEIDWKHVDKITDELNLGDVVNVKVIRIENGKVSVSRKALIPKPEGYTPPQRRSSDRRGGGRRDGYRRDSGPRGGGGYRRDSGGRGGDRRGGDRRDSRR